MFDRIARRYDLVNTLLSGGTDQGWRRKAAAATLISSGGRALDIACGSGRLSAELLARGAVVVGLDFSREMLHVAQVEQPRVALVRGDALALPFPPESFDAVTIAFGLRNLADPAGGLGEMLRVLRPGGRAVVLEFVRPSRGLVGRAYRVYLRHVLPRIGGAVSGDAAAYRYLSSTVDSYHTPGELLDMARAAGWQEPSFRGLNLGTVGLLAGAKTGSPAGL
jgi:demethylmenaquinone methyltransferase / 2-methoxy-6-polyprenyl-1,4-benzoquinol methylase